MATFAGFKTTAVLWASLALASAAANVQAGPAPYEIKASGIRDNAARITWTTDIPGSTQVEYGLKKSYGKKSNLDNLPRMNHFMALKGLKRNTTYHYRVTTTDIFSKVHTSSDCTFTTLKTPPPKGKVYYVSTKGNDGNNGLSLKTAWRRIGYAAGRVRAGDTVKIEAGTYKEAPGKPERYVEIKTGGKRVPVVTVSAVNIKASGTDVNPITFEAISGVVLLDGSKYTKGGTFGIKITGSYVHVRGLKIKGYTIGIRPRGTSHVCISNCEVGPTGSIGIKARNNTYLIIDKCDVHNNGWNSIMLEIDQQPKSQSHHYTITNCKVHDNSAHNLIDTTVHFGNKNSHHHFDIINNDLYKCTSNGFFNHWDKPHKPVLKHFNWSGNKLHHNGTHAMRVDALVDSYVYNNTFSDNSPKRGDSEITGSCRNVTFYKNSGARYVNAKGDGLLFLRNKFPYIRTGGGLATVRDSNLGKFSVRTDKGKVVVEFTDGKVFSRTVKHSSGKYSMTEPEYLPGGSRFQMEAGAWATSRIIAYPLCTVPEKGAVEITDVALSPLSFTANTKDGNKVTFTAEGLKPGKKYVVKIAGKVLVKAAADKTGKIKFTHSNWKRAGKFTIEPAE